MMKEKAIPKRVKGTVLFTVVSVMMVLIVFLMGTLALASTASNRSYRNYQKEQTEANARAVLDAVLQAVNDDAGLAGGLKAQFGALALNGSFDITVQSSDGIDTVVTVTKIDDTWSSFDTASQAWGTGNVYEVSTEILMESTGVSTVYAAYLTDSEIVAAPPTSRTTGGGGAFVAMGGTGDNSIGTGGFTAGGTTMNLHGVPSDEIKFMNDCVMEAPVYLNGTPTFNASVSVYYSGVGEGQYFAVEGDFTLANNFKFECANPFTWPGDPATVDYTHIPTLYVGGTLRQSASDLTFNKDLDYAMNVYCGKVETGSVNAFSIKGDLYCFDETATSTITNQNSNKLLYKWSDATFTHTNITQPDGTTVKANTFGNYYSKGSAVWKGFSVDGDIRVEKNLTIQSGPTVEAKDVVVAGTLTIESGATLQCNNIYAGVIVNNGNINCSGTINAFEGTGVTLTNDYDGAAELIGSKETTYVLKNDEGYTDGVRITYSGNIKIEYYYTMSTINYDKNGIASAPILQTITEEEYIWSLPWDWAGTAQEYVENVGTDKLNALRNAAALGTVTENLYAYDIASKYGEPVYPDGYTKDEIRANVLNVPSASSYAYPTTLAELNDTLTVLDASGNCDRPKYSSMRYDTTNNGTASAPITGSFQLDEAPSGNLYIKPSGPMAIIIPAGKQIYVPSGSNIIIDDDFAVYFFIDTGSRLEMCGGNIITDDYNNLLTSGSSHVITEVQPSASSQYYPDVYVYGAAGSAFHTQNNSLLTMNFRAPLLDFSADNGWNYGGTITYKQTTTRGEETSRVIPQRDKERNLALIGQLIAGTIKVGNEWNMIYVTLGSNPTCTCSHTTDGSGICSGDPSTCTCGGCCSSCICPSIVTPPPPPATGIPQNLYTMYYNFY